jgi:hypothetical protein
MTAGFFTNAFTALLQIHAHLRLQQAVARHIRQHQLIDTLEFPSAVAPLADAAVAVALVTLHYPTDCVTRHAEPFGYLSYRHLGSFYLSVIGG